MGSQDENEAADKLDQNACGLAATDDRAWKTEFHTRSGANGHGVCAVAVCRLENITEVEIALGIIEKNSPLVKIGTSTADGINQNKMASTL